MTGRKGKRAKSKKNIGRFTAADYGLPESKESIDWSALASEEDDEDVVETTTVKDEQATTSSSPTRTLTKKRSARNRGIRLDEPVNLEIIHRGQQRLHAEQARLATEFERISAELRNAEKRHNSMEKMVKKILSKIGCSSSVDTDSD